MSWKKYFQIVLAGIVAFGLGFLAVIGHFRLRKFAWYDGFWSWLWDEQKLVAVILILGVAVGITYTAYSVGGRHKKLGHAMAAALGVALAPALFGFSYPEIREELHKLWREVHTPSQARQQAAKPVRDIMPEDCASGPWRIRLKPEQVGRFHLRGCQLRLALAGGAVTDEVTGKHFELPPGRLDMPLNEVRLHPERDMAVLSGAGGSVGAVVVVKYCRPRTPGNQTMGCY